MNVAFLWHMHQPNYVDNAQGVALMPWVRLHAMKGYLDMIWLVEQYPEFHCTFNLTPVLLRQIEQFAHNDVRDLWLELATTPAADLTLGQQSALLEHYFKAHWHNMIKPHARYWSLLQQRGTQVERADLPRIAAGFHQQEYRDLQVWYHLAWFGYAAERLHPEIGELKRKGRDFTEQDKETLFDCQHKVLRSIVKHYKTAAERGQIEICTSPFYHPILPLLCNNEFAHRCMPGCRLPPPFVHPEDVRAQLQLACEQHTTLFGAPPRGLWPSEGSVCPELVPLLGELGFQWLATDEEILWRSLPNDTTPDRNLLYQDFQVEQGTSQMCIAFRDRSLSDFIGFTAARNPPHHSAELLLGQIEQINRNQGARAGDALCPIILDGENAWEHFADGGETFLRSLYERLIRHPHLRTTTFQQHFQSRPSRTALRNLYTGSWINADFHIWIGDQEDNRAWQLLTETRDFLKAQKHLAPQLEKKAFDEIYAAEGSDWFWWYGDQFVTENDLLFDELFRTHLQNVYRLLGMPVPAALKAHICRSELNHVARTPTELITPTIDGKVTSFYEWAGSGLYEAEQGQTTMYRNDRLLDAIHYGYDLTNFYLRADFRPQAIWPSNAALHLHFHKPTRRLLEITPLERGRCIAMLFAISENGRAEKRLGPATVAFQEVLEAAIPFRDLGWNNGEQVAFVLQLHRQGVEQEEHPSGTELTFHLPSDDFQKANWRL
jgi:alpha-amylase/alpha-mannosidase (GH57 family)